MCAEKSQTSRAREKKEKIVILKYISKVINVGIKENGRKKVEVGKVLRCLMEEGNMERSSGRGNMN